MFWFTMKTKYNIKLTCGNLRADKICWLCGSGGKQKAATFVQKEKRTNTSQSIQS
jgi:hypothetical protein